MGFFNSLLIRITLAVLGGTLYALLTYALILSLNLSSPLAIPAALFVYLLYLGSRLLLLFSGMRLPLLSTSKKRTFKNTPRERILSKRQPNGWGNFIINMTLFYSFFWDYPVYCLPCLPRHGWVRRELFRRDDSRSMEHPIAYFLISIYLIQLSWGRMS